ncbi:MAG: hypothetical protein LBQ69_05090 [Treponema sp.]|jgi:hypothetical protein|nr:hypothetical protein [Treponema sp.]
MAIQPIDLQTLFTQADKVARQQSAQRDGVAIQQVIHGVQLQRKTEEQIQSVNEAQNTGEDGIEQVKDRGAQGQEGGRGKKQDQEDPEGEEAQNPVIRDPFLGRNIDISL